MKILLVEDDKVLNGSLSKLLKTQQFSVDSVFDGQEALDFMAVADYDLVILDVMMPERDGFSVVNHLRQTGDKTPVLMLTARDALEDKVKGLNLGADDYLVKPFAFEELLARIRAMLRRDNRQHLTTTIQVKDIKLDLVSQQVFQSGQLLDLTAKEYQVLEYLLRNPNMVLSRHQIREHVWGFDYEGESNIIDVLIKNIRRKLGDSHLIETKRGQGYVVKGEV